MQADEFETHARSAGHVVERLDVGGQIYFHVRGIPIISGPNDGKTCEVAVLRNAADPWVPESVVHVRPHLIPMGLRASHPSPLGPEWQKLSRRFDKPATPKNFLTHIYTVVGEL